jgi:hypothetical protein
MVFALRYTFTLSPEQNQFGCRASNHTTSTLQIIHKNKNPMKHRFLWVSLLAITAASFRLNSSAATNGVILITTRAPQDTAAGSEFITDEKGPGMVSPGDAEMGSVLSDYGYTCRLVLDKLMNGVAQTWCSGPPPPDAWITTVNTDFAPMLFINSGSSAGADVPPRNTNGIPVMMGEHTDIADRNNPGAIYMYSGGSLSTDPNQGNGGSHYMKVIAPNHPIMQGIPLDAQGRVKIFRDIYPEENAHVPPAGKPNYEYRWCSIPASNAAPATTVIGVLDGNESFSVFAVAETNGLLAFNSNLGYAATNDARLVHIFCNEDGSGGPRRVFHSLTDVGRVIFVRAAKWAMGETLTPYQSVGLINVSLVAPNQLQLSWQGSADRNYKIVGTKNIAGPYDYSNWSTIVQDIPGTNGIVTKTINIANGPQYAFMRVAPMP